MKFLRPILLFLFFVVLSTFILSLVLPVHQKAERSIIINAPANVVYDQLSKLSDFSKWAVWTQNDSSAIYTFHGTDGKVGASTSWSGNPSISGQGEIVLSGLSENNMVMHDVYFKKPTKRKATSTFTISDHGTTTTVTWSFKMNTPRPWNIFNLFYSMDKERGDEFEKGLNALKNSIEKDQGTAGKNYEVHPFNFSTTRYAMIRETMQQEEMSSFFAQHFPILFDSARNAGINPGTASALYFSFNKADGKIDLAVAIPIDPAKKLENSIISMYDIPSSKALYADFDGPYENIADAYNSLDKYVSENKLKTKKPSIELYMISPMDEKDSNRWKTRIIYIIE